MRLYRLGLISQAVLLVSIGCLLSACPDSGGGIPASSGASLSGTAAVGAPLTNATITVKDRNGLQATGTTGADGKYSVNVSTLTAPFLLKVTAVGNPDRYSVGSQAGIVNLTPLTDMVVRNYYRARGLDVATLFTTLSSTDPIPTTDEVALLVNQTKNLVARSLEANGVDADGYNFITTSFNANNAGVDAVLASSTLTDNGTTMTLTVTEGGTTQTSLVTANAGTSLVTAATTVTNGANTAARASSTLVPSTSNALAALAGANATLTQLKNLVNANGAALTGTHLTALIAPGARMDGLGATQLPGQLAGDLRGKTIATLSAGEIVSYDDANKIIAVGMLFVHSTVTGPVEQKLTMLFKQVGTSWLLYGTQQLAAIGFHVESLINHDNLNGTVASKQVSVDIRAPQGLIDTGAGVRISCPTLPALFNNTPVPQSGTDIATFHPTTNPADDFTVTSDVFFVKAANLATYPPPGTVCNITMTPTGLAPVSYQVVTGATTTETTTLTTSVPGFAVANVRGQTVNMTWTLPTTLQIRRIRTAANAQNALNGNTIVSEVEHGPTETSGSVSIPATVGGLQTSQTTINLGYDGSNGERISHLYSYNQ